MAKKQMSGPILTQIWPPIFFWILPLPDVMLDIVASYHRIQFQGKCMIQTQKNGKKPHVGSDLRPLHSILGRQFFFFLQK